MGTFLRSARDPSLSNEAKSGLVKVVALLKAASNGKQPDCSAVVSFPNLPLCQPVNQPYEIS